MTVAELAKRLKATVPEVFEHYKRILIEIPQDENHILTTEQIKRAIPKYEPENGNQANETKPNIPGQTH